MRTLAILGLLVALSSCAHSGSRLPPALSGRWYSGHALNKTDYRLEDCTYSPAGTFVCLLTDRGCAEGFCEAEKLSFSGRWRVQGTRLTREVTSGWLPKGATSWSIERQDRHTLHLSGGERWYRLEKLRNQAVLAAP